MPNQNSRNFNLKYKIMCTEKATKEIGKLPLQNVNESFEQEFIMNDLTIRLTFDKEKQSLNIAAFGDKCHINIEPHITNSIRLNFR